MNVKSNVVGLSTLLIRLDGIAKELHDRSAGDGLAQKSLLKCVKNLEKVM